MSIKRTVQMMWLEMETTNCELQASALEIFIDKVKKLIKDESDYDHDYVEEMLKEARRRVKACQEVLLLSKLLSGVEKLCKDDQYNSY